jgi:hypothetical protein
LTSDLIKVIQPNHMANTPTLEALKEATQVKEQIIKLEAQLAKILTGISVTAAPAKAVTKVGRSKMSAAARAKISAAAKARWAKVKAKQPAAPKAPAAPKKKKGTITPEGRAKLAALMKARWAARRKGAAAPNQKSK